MGTRSAVSPVVLVAVLVLGMVAGVTALIVRDVREGRMEVDDRGFAVDGGARDAADRLTIRNAGSRPVRICAGSAGVCARTTDAEDLAGPGRDIDPGDSIKVELPYAMGQIRLTLVGAGPEVTHPDVLLKIIRTSGGR